jgi:hypothetical protein
VKNKKKKIQDEKQIHDIALQILPKGQELTHQKPAEPTPQPENNETSDRLKQIGMATAIGAVTGLAGLATGGIGAGLVSAVLEGSLGAGLTTATEAMAIPSVVGSIASGAVASGTNEALGNSEAANVIAGLVSGAVGGAAAKKIYKLRQSRMQNKIDETTALLTNGKRLGGKKSGRSNLVPPEPGQPPKESTSMLDTIKQIAAKKARQATKQAEYIQNKLTEGVQHVGDTISNVRQKMTSGRGVYSRVPTTFNEDNIMPVSQHIPEMDFETEYANLQHTHLQQEPIPPTQPPVRNRKVKQSPAIRVISPEVREGMRQRKNIGSVVKQIQFKPNSPKPKGTYAVIPQSKSKPMSTQTNPITTAYTTTQTNPITTANITTQTRNTKAIQNLGMLSDGVLQQNKTLNTMEGLEQLIKGKQKQHNIQNFGEITQNVLTTNKKNTLQGYKQLVTRERKAISNLGQLSQNVINSNKKEFVKGIKIQKTTVQPDLRQMLLRSGTITGEARTKAHAAVKAFREKAPETVRLTNQIADINRGKVQATPEKLASLKAQREEAKIREGVGKRGPKGSPPRKLSKKAAKVSK